MLSLDFVHDFQEIYYHTSFSFFFFNDTATTEIYTLSLHDALPILPSNETRPEFGSRRPDKVSINSVWPLPSTPAIPTISDRKSTRLNSSHANISYAVFCLKKKKKSPIIELIVHISEYTLNYSR